MIGQRLRSIRKRLGYSQKSISKLIGTSQSNYSKMERGVFPPNNAHMMLLKENLNINPEWIFKGLPPSLIEKPIFEHFLIPVISEIPSGSWENWIDHLKPGSQIDYIFHPEFIKIEKFFAVSVDDNSMKPLLLKGDILIIDPRKEYRSGIAIVNKKQGYKICYVRKLSNHKYLLIPHNPEFSEEEITVDENIRFYVPVKVISLKDVL